MKRAPLRLVLAAVVLALSAVQAQDTTRSRPRTAALAGLVRDHLGRGISGATLAVDGSTLQTVTNDSGHFFLGGIPAGINDFTVARIGHVAMHFTVDLAPDTTLVVNIPMRAVQRLAGVEVRGERLSPRLLIAGFYERRTKGRGSFVTPERIDSTPVLYPSHLLRDVRGVRVRCRSAGGCVVTPSAGGCFAVLINKSLVYVPLDDAVAISQVYAIEVYERPLLVPQDFSLPARFSRCGVIAVWTSGFAEP